MKSDGAITEDGKGCRSLGRGYGRLERLSLNRRKDWRRLHKDSYSLVGLHAEWELLRSARGLVFPMTQEAGQCRDCGEQALERGLQRLLRGVGEELSHPCYHQSAGKQKESRSP